MAKFGKKNKIKLDILRYNLGLIGESGVGKSTLAKEVCKKLVGDEGYLMLNIGKEDGIDAIDGAMYEDISDWGVFDAFVKDVVANKDTDYKDLKVCVFDTIDELFSIAEPQVIRLHNRQFPEKTTKNINSAFGGFGKGSQKAIDIVLENMWKLKKVGVSMFVIGHTKQRVKTDILSGEEYTVLTNKVQNNYFDAVKTKLHVLGVASVDREIVKEAKKNKVTGKDEYTGKIAKESRVITFRDDSYSVESKSRFAEIEPRISLNSDEFIGAIQDAIKAGYAKNNNVEDIAKAKVEQDEEIKKAQSESLDNRFSNDELVEQIQNGLKVASAEKKAELKAKMQELKVVSFKTPESLDGEVLKQLVAIF